jgi:dihydropteroate synthase
MGIVNATPDSFSDRQGEKGPDELVARGLAHARAFTWERVGETMLHAWREALA